MSYNISLMSQLMIELLRSKNVFSSKPPSSISRSFQCGAWKTRAGKIINKISTLALMIKPQPQYESKQCLRTLKKRLVRAVS